MELELRHLNNDSEQQFYIFAPGHIASGTPVFASVHGVSLNALSHAELFLPYAKKHNAVLVVPLFKKERFIDYNCLGLTGKGERADRQFINILEQAGAETGADVSRIFLFGYSAGAQFAHRFALVYPERIKKLCLGAPGYFSMPGDAPFPLGLTGMGEAAGKQIDLDAFLRIPLCLCVGAEDTCRDTSLLQSDEVDALQGHTRRERCLNWFTRVVSLASDRGFSTEYLFKILANCPHSFEKCMETGRMGGVVFEFLFSL
jgi:pimeloyl-ACP methyl ester carboxylesterase